MVRDYDEAAPVGTNKVVVCITAQQNSERLINEASAEADKLNAELHILNVNKGTSIFNNSETPMLIEKLFAYGSAKGGMVHMICSEDVADAIGGFIDEYSITHIVLGEPPVLNPKTLKESEFNRIEKAIRERRISVTIVKRD